MTLKKVDFNKKLYNYRQALKILKEDDYLYCFLIVEDETYTVNSENKLEVINALNNAIAKLNKDRK